MMSSCALAVRWFTGIDEVMDPDRLECATDHLIFNRSISERKTIMLSLVFGPRIDEKSLKILPWKFGVIIHTPARRAVSAANSLILVNRFEKFVGFVRIHLVFNGNKHRTLVGLRLR